MVLESIFGSKTTSTSSAAAGPSSEREPLLANLGGERPGAAGYGTAGPSQRFVVPKPPRVKTPVRVETKVWLANEVSVGGGAPMTASTAISAELPSFLSS